MIEIGIIGTGYVGLIQAVGLAKLGFKVNSLDIDEKKINQLKKGEPTIYEDGLNELLNEVKDNINFTSRYEDLNSCKVIFIAVGTPQDKRGRTNKDFLHKAAISIKQKLDNNDKTIVIKSTVPVGTNKEISKILGDGFQVVSNPEFLREGKAIYDFFNPDRVVVGFGNNAEISKKRMKIIYNFFIEKNIPYIETNWETAELIKYAANSFLATKISFINEMSQLASKTGANILELSEGIGLDKRIGKSFLNAGLGYGGSCFPKDVKSLIHQFKENGLEGKIISSVDEVNQNQLNYFYKKIEDFYDNLEGKNFLILGLAFKPDTDDLRESRSIELSKKLIEKGANVYGFDPLEKARDNVKNFYPEIKVIDNLDNFIENNLGIIDGIIIGTEYKIFNHLNWEKIKEEISMPVIFDGRNILNEEIIKKHGFIYKKI